MVGCTYKDFQLFFIGVSDFLLIILFTWITWAANNNGGFGPVVASSAVGVIIGLIDKDRAAGIYTGSFAGMVNAKNILGWGWITLLGILTALIFKIFSTFGLANGLGGRLGFMAQISCSVVLLLRYLVGMSSTTPFFDAEEYGVLSYPFIILMLCLTPFSATLTIWLQYNVASVDNSVTASAVVGLSGAMIFHSIWGNSILAKDACLAFFTGSFVGMSSPNRIPDYSGFFLVGMVAGAIHISLLGIFTGGYGGKLGTIAFLSTSLFQLVLPFWPKSKRFQKQCPNDKEELLCDAKHTPTASTIIEIQIPNPDNEIQQNLHAKPPAAPASFTSNMIGIRITNPDNEIQQNLHAKPPATPTRFPSHHPNAKTIEIQLLSS